MPDSVAASLPKLQEWAALLSSGRAEKHKESKATGLQALRQEYNTTIAPTDTLAAGALNLENQINDLVNRAYELTPEEIDLMWKTAPPRMTISKNQGKLVTEDCIRSDFP